MNRNGSASLSPRLLGAGALGSAGMLLTLVVGENGMTRFFANWVLWYVVLLSVGVGALFLVALEHLVSARWSVPLRRTIERVSSLVWLLVPVAVVALLGMGSLYEWVGPEAEHDPVIAGKAVYLNVPFFAVRVAVCLGLWLLFYTVLVGGSRRQDEGQAPNFPARAKALAAPFMIVFALTVSVSAFDWIMSLEPHWFSTIIGVYLFAGCMTSGLAASILAALYLIKRDRLPGVRPDHMYNLGALMFAFNIFWAYIAFSQFMLIWYGNLPEETVFYHQRFQGAWGWVSAALALLHFAVPFFALLSRPAKCDYGRLRWVSIWMLACHALDVYWYIFPTLGWGFVLGWQEVAFALFFVALAVGWTARAMTRGNDMPRNDPNLAEGLEFHL